MQTKTITTYKFSELANEAKKKAIEDMYNLNTEGIEWWDFVYEDWQEKLEKLGYYETKIFFTGFSSQGDGACFEGKLDIGKWLKAHKLANKYRALYNREEEGIFQITQHGHYYHENSMEVDNQYYDTYGLAGRQCEAVYELVEKEIVELAKSIYRDLEKEYEYQTSEESIISTIEANEYDFLEDGSRKLYI